MPYDDYELIRVTVHNGVCRATIDNPPINLMDINLIGELARFAAEATAEATRGWWSSTRPIPTSSSPTPMSR